MRAEGADAGGKPVVWRIFNAAEELGEYKQRGGLELGFTSAFRARASAEKHAARHAMSLANAWNAYNVAAPLVPKRRAHGVALVDPALWRALEALEGHAVLGGTLTALREALARRGLDVPFEALRFARTCLL